MSVLALLPLLAAATGCTPVGAAVGAGAMVATAAAEERGVGGSARDVRISLEIIDRFDDEGVLFEGIGATVFDGRVLLTGAVADADLHGKALALAGSVEGVRTIIDRVTVTPDPEGGTGPRDALVTAELRKAIMFDPEVLAINYAIEVEDGIVHLLGIAQSERERRRVIAHARGTDFVRGIEDHVLLKTDPRRSDPGARPAREVRP
ncbi:BON domain-containing protein [Caenispirillum salinarum]|uniref:BON domain-containing protein n=1 Tax=Caenispirillum salinarum TaxID=859058 RepID=UPI00384C2381